MFKRQKLIFIIAAIASFLLSLSLPSALAFQKEWNPSLFGVQGLTLGLSSLKDVAAKALVAQNQEIDKFQSIPQAFRGKIVRHVDLKNPQKVIALSFDDGPWPNYTNQVLYILDYYGIKSTFFIIGRNAQKYPQQVKEVYAHGHVLANHTWNHGYGYHSPARAASEIDRTSALIYKLTGANPSLFRPPGGFLHNGLAAHAMHKGMAVAMWSSDSKDYNGSAASIIHNSLKDAHPGGIILFHDGGGDRDQTVIALPTIIEELQKQGYQFVTIPELLDLKAKEMPKVSPVQAQQSSKQPQRSSLNHSQGKGKPVANATPKKAVANPQGKGKPVANPTPKKAVANPQGKSKPVANATPKKAVANPQGKGKPTSN